VLIQYIEHPETASYSWNYAGGCYENGNFAKYANAQIGQTYSLEKIPIEVRQLPTDLLNGSSDFGVSSLFWLLSWICMGISFVFMGLLGFNIFKEFKAGKGQ
jgi:hypothetical protein